MAGVGRYSVNMFEHLARTREDLVSIDWRPSDELQVYLQTGAARHCSIENRWPVLKTLLWHAFLMKNLKRSTPKIDVLFSPSQFLHILGRPPVPFVYVVHDVSFMTFPECHKRGKKLLFLMFFQKTLEKADHIICDSQYSRDELQKYFAVRNDRVSVVHAASEGRFAPIRDQRVLEGTRERYALPERFVLYVGTIEPRKNLECLLQAYHLSRANLSLPLIIAGKIGWRSQPIFDVYRTHNLHDVVRFLGYVPDEDLPAMLNLATAFVYVSKDEGFGLPPLEAMQCGVPVIVSNGGSLPEIVGDAGYFVPHDDPRAIAEAVIRLSNDQSLREELSAKGLSRSKLFSWDATVQKLRGIFSDVVNGS